MEATSNELGNWIIEIKEMVTNVQPQEMQRKEPSIFKVPHFMREHNPRAFTPVFISFGPFHHDDAKLKEMKCHKQRALVRFLRKANQIFEKVVEEVGKHISELRDAYSSLDEKWMTNDFEFVKMMVEDGCYMLEMLQFSIDHGKGYSEIDPHFSMPAVRHNWPMIRRDMLLIENQLPMSMLKTLVTFQAMKAEDEQNIDRFINNLILKFVCGCKDLMIDAMLGRAHVLALYRRYLLSPFVEAAESQLERGIGIRSTKIPIGCVKELYEAGVQFEISNLGYPNDFSFNPTTGKFKLPLMVWEDATECTILNIMAFEQLHARVDFQFTSYFSIMGDIVGSANDVKLLSDKGFIWHSWGSAGEQAEMFNRIAKVVQFDPYDRNLTQMKRDIWKYCRRRRNRWLANLMQTYFKNPWSAISLAAALFIIMLTMLQTFYTVFPYYHPAS